MNNQNYDIEKIVYVIKEVIKELDNEIEEPGFGSDSTIGYRKGLVTEKGFVQEAQDIKEVGIAIGPAYGLYMTQTINGLGHIEVLKELMAGIEEEGMTPRVLRVTRTSDVAFVASDAAKLVGSGIAIGIQSKGTAVIHQKDLFPLTNLELFPQAPILTLEIYRAIGKNAAKYAKGEQVIPVTVINDIYSRPKYQVKAALMHTKETEYVIKRGPFIEIAV